MEDLSEETRIAYGNRVDAFLKDEAVQHALAGLQRGYFEQFKTPNLTPEALQYLHAKVRVLSDFGDALQSVLNAGTVAKAVQQQREKREQAERQRRR